MKMLALKGIYDGKSIQLIDKPAEKKKYKVIVTFVEEIKEVDEELRNFTAQTNGLDFWNDPKEDLYQDYLKNKPKKK